MKYIFIFLTVTLLSGCSVIRTTPSQEEVLGQLQGQLQTLMQENEVIQAGTAAYNENMQKIEAIQTQIQYYQDQIQKVQQQVQGVHDQANAIKDSAGEYTEQGKGWLRGLGEKLQSIK